MFGSDFSPEGSVRELRHGLAAGHFLSLLGPLYLACFPRGERKEESGETQQGEWVSWPHGHLSMSLGVGMGCGAAGWEQRAGYQHQVVRLSGGVCRTLQDK